MKRKDSFLPTYTVAGLHIQRVGRATRCTCGRFLTAGGKWQVSTGGGSQPRWRNDGKELFYIAADAKLMAAPIGCVAAGARRDVRNARARCFRHGSPSGAGISLTGWQSRALYAVAADGRFLMNVMIEADHQSPITLVQNWQQLLKK